MNFYSIVLNILLLVVGIVAALVALEYFVRFQQKRRWEKEDFTTLLIRVARDNETGPIVAEQIFSTIHGVAKSIGFWDRLKGVTQEKMSFEIASTDRSIRFYAHFPTRLRNLIEGQIYAQYPNVEITEIADYARPKPVEVSERNVAQNGAGEGREVQALVTLENQIQEKQQKQFMAVDELKNAIGADLAFSSPDIFPIKRYPQFEDKTAKVQLDPLSAITSTLAKFNDPDEQAWIQVVVRPLDDKWRSIFTKCIRILNKGIYLNIARLQGMYAKAYTTRSRIVRTIFFPVYWLFGLQGLNSGASTESSGSIAPDDSSRTHDRESGLQGAQDKIGKLLYEANVRIVYVPKHANKDVALVKLREIAGSFKQFSIPQVNGFVLGGVASGEEIVKRYQNRELIKPFVMSVEELATVYHLPNVTVTTPNIYWVRSRRLEPPGDLPTPKEVAEQDLTLLGKTNFRGSGQPFGIKTLDRRRHIYIIGKTGMGKSTLLENMIFSDIQAGRGCAVVDPHGDLADAVLDFVPSHRTNDVVIFDPSDREFPVAFNMLENIDPSLNSIVCSGLVGIFKKIYGQSWGPRLEHILRNVILSLLMYPNTTMLGIPRILQDAKFRGQVVRKITDPIVKSFWENEFDKLEPRQRIEAISPILNKVGQFLSSPIIRNILGQPKSAVDLRFAMDKGKIVVVNLSKGKIGEDTSSLLGAMMITKFQLDAMSRANIAEKERKDFYLYVDEFQNFATDSFATILSEARKYRLNLTMANQYIAQMPEEVRDAVFGNVGTIMSFQVGFDDAEYLSGQYGEEVMPNDLVSLSKYTAYSRLLIDGMPSQTFSLDTLPPPDLDFEEGRREKIIRLARERYATDREVVEDKIRRWSESGKKSLDSGKKPELPEKTSERQTSDTKKNKK
ncbi:DUF87 domain-containing protein [Candidatus Peregrinibacteria bacterium]|nr:DUF87 domain-containing protein [Candidatus Peregrinibacteria bacterium]